MRLREFELECPCGGQIHTYDCLQCGTKHPNLVGLVVTARSRYIQFKRDGTVQEFK